MQARALVPAAVALLALPGCTTGSTSPQPSTTVSMPPPAVGQPVIVDESVPGWEVSVYLATDHFCVHTVQYSDDQLEPSSKRFNCIPSPPALYEDGPPLLPTKPLPQVVPYHPDDVMLVGTVRGDIASVSVTMFGKTATSTVHPLPASDDRQIGAYAVWLPHSEPGSNGMTLNDITAVIGYDAVGDVIVQLD